MTTSVLVASTGRPALLRQCLEAYIATTLPHPVELCVVVDDAESFVAALGVEAAHYHAHGDGAERWRVRFALHQNPARVGAIKAWNQALALSQGEILHPAGDDQRPRAGWLDYALEMHARQLEGYGCVGLNDLMNLPKENGLPIVCTTLMFDRKFCKERFGGVVAYPAYQYLWVDVEHDRRARRCGKLAWCEAAIVEHMHPAAGKRAADAMDAEHSQTWIADETTFNRRSQAGFPDDFEPVI